MAIMLKIDNEGLFLIGQALQEPEDMRVSPVFLDLEDGSIIGLEKEELDKDQSRTVSRYIEIPYNHAELHEWLDEFVWSLDKGDARKAGEEKYGIGETLDAMDKYMDARSEFSVFIAKKWLAINS
jgi:hypothetical protein